MTDESLVELVNLSFPIQFEIIEAMSHVHNGSAPRLPIQLFDLVASISFLESYLSQWHGLAH